MPMQRTNKMYIRCSNGSYVKSVSPMRGMVSFTKQKRNAKGYTSLDAIHSDIDICMRYTKNLTFYYE